MLKVAFLGKRNRVKEMSKDTINLIQPVAGH
jgi:hypothetical protein